MIADTSRPARIDRQFSRKKPCGECPFSRACEPSKTGGASPTVYVGQAYGPFWLPCHMDANYSKEDALKNAGVIAQCAGAAIFRANVRIDARMPRAIHRLPAETVGVFATPAELIAHHNQISLEEAEEYLRETPPRMLLLAEVNKLNQKHLVITPTLGEHI